MTNEEIIFGLKERLRESESLLAEMLRLGIHHERHGRPILTAGHENRIRKFLQILPRGQETCHSSYMDGFKATCCRCGTYPVQQSQAEVCHEPQ